VELEEYVNRDSESWKIASIKDEEKEMKRTCDKKTDT